MKQIISIKKCSPPSESGMVNSKQNVIELHIPRTFEDIIFEDIEQMLSSSLSLAQHYSKIISSPEKTYKGCNKFEYARILKIVQIIIESKRKRRSSEFIRAIECLYLALNFSTTLIRNILALFGVRIGTAKILQLFISKFEAQPKPKWWRNLEDSDLSEGYSSMRQGSPIKSMLLEDIDLKLAPLLPKSRKKNHNGKLNSEEFVYKPGAGRNIETLAISGV